jgi:uncharacterized protein
MQRLQIPFGAIKVFADPGVEFGLQFTLDDDDDNEAAAAAEPVKRLGMPDHGGGEAGGDDRVPPGGAEIVTLDRFRKK